MDPLTQDQIAEARTAILRNAAELLADARLLANNERFPRAFSLAVLACEELAKLPMLNNTVTELLTDNEVDWTKLHSHLNQHARKLAIIHLFTAFPLEGRWDDLEYLKKLGSTSWRKTSLVKNLNQGKLDGFYVAIDAGMVRTPWDRLPKERVLSFLEAADGLLILLTEVDRVVSEQTSRIRGGHEGYEQLLDELRLLHKARRGQL